jgi:hypothetical protein
VCVSKSTLRSTWRRRRRDLLGICPVSDWKAARRARCSPFRVFGVRAWACLVFTLSCARCSRICVFSAPNNPKAEHRASLFFSARRVGFPACRCRGLSITLQCRGSTIADVESTAAGTLESLPLEFGHCLLPEDATPKAILKGLYHSAQGCAPSATLGAHARANYPERVASVVPLSVLHSTHGIHPMDCSGPGCNPYRVGVHRAHTLRVALGAQPWVECCNPFGIGSYHSTQSPNSTGRQETLPYRALSLAPPPESLVIYAHHELTAHLGSGSRSTHPQLDTLLPQARSFRP